MLQIDHRESFDVDIFIDDPQALPYLNPQTQGIALDITLDAIVPTERTRSRLCLKISAKSTSSWRQLSHRSHIGKRGTRTNS